MAWDKVDSNRSAAPKNKGPRIVKLAILGQRVSSFSFSFAFVGLMFWTSSKPLILLINDTIASKRPIGTAIVKFTNTVNRNVVTRTSKSEFLIFNILVMFLIPSYLTAKTTKIGAILASGKWEQNGANKSGVIGTKHFEICLTTGLLHH